MEQDAVRLIGALGRTGLGLQDPLSVQDAARRLVGSPLASFAAREGLGSFFLWALERAGALPFLPGPARDDLERVARLQHETMVRVHLVAAQALRHLAGLGIPAVVVKGLAVSSFWPAPLLRTMQDVDLLVPLENRDLLWDHYGPLWDLQACLGITPEVEPCHHDLTVGDTVPISFEDVFARSTAAEVAGVQTRVADARHLLLFAAANSLRKDPRALRGILDVAFLVSSGRVDLVHAAREARALGLAPPLRLLLRLAQTRFGLVVPTEILATLATPRDRLVESYLGLDRPTMSPRLLAGGGASRWFLRLLMEPMHRLARRSIRNFFPRSLALRNQNAKRGDHGRSLAFLYLRHWWGFLRRLAGGTGQS